MDFGKSKQKIFNEDMKSSKTFTVAHTEYYELRDGRGIISASLIIPEDYFKIREPITDVDFFGIEGRLSEITLDVHTKRGLSFDEAIKLYKKFSNENFFNDYLWDDYMGTYNESVKVKSTEWEDTSIWLALYMFQEEANKASKKETME